MKTKLLNILKEYWGYDSFREMQYEIISSVLSGRDTLALMPTGGGKSITYQLPTMVSEGMCIVITPLIALMKDQVDRLKSRGISAVAIHSGLSRRKIDIALDNCVYGDVKFLYIAPERLTSDILQLRVRRMNVTLIAVDEAHCISEWGHDFRPAYRHISQLRELLPDIPILALTASATDRVVEDIMENLGFEDGKVLRSSFSRPNISYVVRKVDDKNRQLMRIIESVPGSGIIYTRKRETTEVVCQNLIEQGISASYYHGGLPAEERSIRQDEWVSGKVRVMVATNAFGMGIDKADVRFVVHYTMSDSLESYYQEAGRAGRDGQRSYAVLFVAPKDHDRLVKRMDSDFPPLEQVKAIYDKICSYLFIAIGDGKGYSYNFNIFEFCSKEHIALQNVLSVLDLLERNEYMTYVEEADQPARMIFKVSRDELYRCEMTPAVEQVVRVIMRMYNGLFSEFRAIDEQSIAAALGCKQFVVHQALKDLWRRQIIRYVPANHSPMIYMNEERLPSSDLYIAPQTYIQRREQIFERFNNMVKYAEDDTRCRSMVFEEYFGDKNAKECGVCDVCLAQKRDQQKVVLEQRIVEMLESGPMLLRDVVSSLSASEQGVIAAVRELMLQGRISLSPTDMLSIVPTGGRSE